jgi:NitT/TauT family transport system ATP-binding protein
MDRSQSGSSLKVGVSVDTNRQNSNPQPVAVGPASSGPSSASAQQEIKALVENVGVDYRHPSTRLPFCAVRDASFTVGKREMVSVVGPSGCGKSTLLSAVAGLVPYSRGRIVVDDKQVEGPGAGQAIVFQKAALLPWRTALDNVAFPLILKGMKRRSARVQAGSVLSQVGLADFLHYHPHQLSGGMQQRVNLARALVTEPELLLLDEPFAAVDSQMRELLQEWLLSLLAESELTGVFVTHQIDEAVLMGDRIVVLSRGPGSTIKAVIDVPLPRPRDIRMRNSKQFLDIVSAVWEAVREEIALDGVVPGRGQTAEPSQGSTVQ